jgi:hypothetical protein
MRGNLQLLKQTKAVARQKSASPRPVKDRAKSLKNEDKHRSREQFRGGPVSNSIERAVSEQFPAPFTNARFRNTESGGFLGRQAIDSNRSSTC